MPALYLATGRTAGEECSSTYEGRHITIEETYLVHPYHADGFVDKGDPCIIDGGGDYAGLVGVALNSADAATDLIALDTEGIWFLNVLGRTSDGTSDGIAKALKAGDPVAIMKAPGVNTTILTGETDWSHFVPFGHVLGDVTAHVSTPTIVAVKVHCEAHGTVDGFLNFGSGSTAAGNMLLEGSTTLRESVALRGCFAPETLLTAGEQIHGINFRIVDNLIATGGEITCAEFKAVRDEATDVSVSSMTALKIDTDNKNGGIAPFVRGIDIMMEGAPGTTPAIRSAIHVNSSGTAGTKECLLELEAATTCGGAAADKTGGGKTAAISVMVAGSQYWIQLYAA
ncbi:MAG: hypothetical protein WC565_10160 [Parcubacteria group bacterium]|jgi:hypothetical protein